MNAANALTLLSAASAVIGLLALVCVRGATATATVVTCIGASLLLDRLDGAVARRLGVTSAMGAQLDSLADLLAFGVLPAVLVAARHPTLAVAGGAVAYALAAVWRLARYDENELTIGRWGPMFRGVPTAAAAAAVAVAVTIGDAVASPPSWWVEPGLLLVMAALMPSSLPYPKRGVGAWPWMVLVPLAVVAQWWRLWAGR